MTNLYRITPSILYGHHLEPLWWTSKITYFTGNKQTNNKKDSWNQDCKDRLSVSLHVITLWIAKDKHLENSAKQYTVFKNIPNNLFNRIYKCPLECKTVWGLTWDYVFLHIENSFLTIYLKGMQNRRKKKKLKYSI